MLTVALLCRAAADPLIAPDGTDAFFGLGWVAAADELCGLNTYRIILPVAKSKGLTDVEIAHNLPKIAKTVLLAQREFERMGADRWCSEYQRGFMKGQ